MTDEWINFRLSDVIILIGGGTPKTINPAYWKGDIPWLSVADFNTGYRYVHSAEKTITRKGLEESSTNLLRKGQLIISARGTVGVLAQLGRDMAFNQSCYGITAKEPLTTNNFLYYLISNEVRGLKQITHGGVFETITRETFDQIVVSIPPISTQHIIANILGSIDDNIEINHQMNITLEAMAQAIFQSWFVDFDPVLAKAEGRDTGLPPEVEEIFPDGFEEIDGREVPKRWRIGRLDELMILQRGFDLPQTQIVEGPYPVVCASGVIGKHNKFMATGPGVTTGRSGVIGKVFFIQEDFWPHNTSLWIREFKISKPHHGFFILKNLDLNAFNAGSAVATLNRNHIHNLPVLIPPEKIVKKFEDVVKPLFLLLHRNEQKSRTLATIRDSLLPRFMSGEIIV